MSVDQPGGGRQSFVEFISSSDKIQDSEANGEFQTAKKGFNFYELEHLPIKGKDIN